MSGSIGGVDASIALQARAPAQPNPLEMVGQFAGIQNALNQAKLWPTIQQTAQVSLAQKNNQAVFGSMAPFLGEPDVSLDRVTNHLAAMEGNGLMTHPVLSEIMALPGTPNSPEWQRALKTMIASRAQVDPNSMVAQAAGTPVDQSTGLAINSGVRAPVYAGGGVTPTTSTQVYPSRGELAGRVQGPPGTGGVPTTAPLGAVTPPELSGLNMGTGRIRDTLPPALRNPNAPRPATLPGQISTGIGPADQANLQARGTSSNAGFNAISEEGVRARGADTLLANMQNDLDRFTSGSGASRVLNIGRFMQTYAPGIAGALGVDKDKIAAQESFDKIANQLADAQGAGSDARLHVNQGANPHADLSPEGVDFIIRQLRGNSAFMMAKQQLAANYPDKTDLQGFNAQVTKNLDPRVFQYAALTPEQKSNYYSGIKNKNERDAFKGAWKYATDNGLIGNSSGGQ